MGNSESYTTEHIPFLNLCDSLDAVSVKCLAAAQTGRTSCEPRLKNGCTGTFQRTSTKGLRNLWKMRLM